MKAGTEINIVVIDGNEMELVLITEALKKLHIIYRIIPFSNVERALEYFENVEGSKPHLIIVDSDTMHLTGEYFVSKLRSNEKLRKIPLWVLTDNEEEEIFFSYLNLPAKSFIVKPPVFKRHKTTFESRTREVERDFGPKVN
ncbi:MAG: response regulator [Bacillota bacterium]